MKKNPPSAPSPRKLVLEFTNHFLIEQFPSETKKKCCRIYSAALALKQIRTLQQYPE